MIYYCGMSRGPHPTINRYLAPSLLRQDQSDAARTQRQRGLQGVPAGSRQAYCRQCSYLLWQAGNQRICISGKYDGVNLSCVTYVVDCRVSLF